MRDDAQVLENRRLEGVEVQEQYRQIHERHRIFPAVFEKRNHKRILDISSGVGIVGKRIQEFCDDTEVVCNDISEAALETMRRAGLKTISFDLDTEETPFPPGDNEFDAVISLATIEHLIHCDHFMQELYRIISPGGHLYLSSPNYAGFLYLMPVLLTGHTFHNPLGPNTRYEFYAHVRYFTYNSLLSYVSSFGFVPEAAYVGVPRESTKFLQLKKSAPAKAFIFQNAMKAMCTTLSPRWASEPVICFQKVSRSEQQKKPKVKKIVL
ncbi:MAG: methyltransferase domain-containing protein [Chitinivibrionales bacterium]|nr:methyltransferase domain-containing protein [Chitinivibrionales bacterium]